MKQPKVVLPKAKRRPEFLAPKPNKQFATQARISAMHGIQRASGRRGN